MQERDLGDEYGWKQVHGDVFRPASHSLLFSALIGAGHQLTTVIFSVIVFAILGELYTEYVGLAVVTLKNCFCPAFIYIDKFLFILFSTVTNEQNELTNIPFFKLIYKTNIIFVVEQQKTEILLQTS